MFSRLLLAYILAFPLICSAVIAALGTLPSHMVAIRMASPVIGHMQLFYDTGTGFSESRSGAVPLQVSHEPRDYLIGLPRGHYRALRIDPGTQNGRYVIERIAILDPDGSVRLRIPLTTLDAEQLVYVERTPDRLVVDTPPGASDPRLVYRPPSPISIGGSAINSRVLALLGKILAYWIGAAALIAFVEWMARRKHRDRGRILALARIRIESQPRVAICVVALAATVVATYPVILLGKSLVSPNDGFVRMLYQDVPYVPGSTDLVAEDVRGNDVGATMLQGIPHSLVQRQALASGELPLWNRYHSAGRPLWAQGLTFLFDPLHWLTLIVPDPAIAWDLKLIAHRFVLAVGVGLVSLAVIEARAPALIVTFLTPFIALFTYRFNHPAFFAITYAPWVLLAYVKLSEATDRRRRALAAVLLAVASSLVLLASTPKESAIVLLATHAAGVLTVLLSRADWRQHGMRLGYAALGGVTFVLLTAPHWLIFLDNLQQSFTAWESPSAQIADRSFAVGFFLSPLVPGQVRPGLHLLGLVLICAALMSMRLVVTHRAVLASGLVAGACLAIAFGVLPGRWLMAVPLLRNIGHLHDVVLTAALPLLLMVCAGGAAALLRMNRRSIWITGCVVAVACAWLYSSVRLAARDDSLEPWAVGLLAPIAIAMSGAVAATRDSSRGTLPVVSATAAALVLVLPGGLHPVTGLLELDALLLQPRPRADLLARSPAVDALHAAEREPFRTLGLDWVLHSGSQVYYGLEGIGGPDPLDVPVYRELLDASGIRRTMVWFTEIPVEEASRFAPLLDILNVGFLLARADAVPDEFADLPSQPADRIRAGRRSSAWPRAFFVDGARTYADAPDLLRLAASAGKPVAAVQRSDELALDSVRSTMQPTGLVVPASAYRLTSNTTGFHVRAPSAGIAVLVESYLPTDFRATLNGRRVPYFRVNHAFKGIAIPAEGDWDVAFEYRPHRWTAALVASGVGMLVLAGLVLIARGRLA